MANAGAARVHAIFKVKAAGRTRIVVFDTQDLSLGRSPENDLAIDEPEMSRKHAVFKRSREGCRVEDMGTSNGTNVNGESVSHAVLSHGDVVKIGEVEITYAETTRNPATLGSVVEYASQLKSLGMPTAHISGDGEATILGLGLEAPGGADDDDFEVLPAGDFDLETLTPKAGRTRDLDAEVATLEPDPIDDFSFGEAVEAQPPAPEVWELDEEAAAAPDGERVTLTLEVEGLRGELRRLIEGLTGKVLEVPNLRIRIKGRDLR
jgi:predicted component of type VI protein secretion system